MDKKLSCCSVFFSTTRKKERESKEQHCQSTETTISVHFRTRRRSVGSRSDSDFFSLRSRYAKYRREEKK